jgi:hypothetical protein
MASWFSRDHLAAFSFRAFAFRFNPLSFVRFIALLRKRAEYSSGVKFTILSVSIEVSPSRGSNRGSFDGFSNLFHGQTS